MNHTDDTLKVLLIEDSPVDADLIRVILVEGSNTGQFDLACADRLSKAIELLTTYSPDAVLLDLSLPDSHGLDTVISIVAQIPRVPIIVLTGMDDEALAARALQEGAQDYIVKNQLDSIVLPRTIRYAIERKQVEDALQASEQRFRALVEKSTDEIVLLDAEFKPSYTSPSVARASGYSPEEIADFKHFGVIHPEDLPIIQKIDAELSGNQDEPQYFQLRLQCKDGSWRWVEGVATNLLADPSVKGILYNYHDITERKQHTRELEAIATISATVRAAKNLDEMLPRLLDGTMSSVRGRAGSIWLYEPVADEIEMICQYGLKEQLASLKRGEGIPGDVISSGQACVSFELKTDPQIRGVDSRAFPAGRGGVCVPIQAEHEIIGALLINADPPHQFTAADVHLLTRLAEIAGNAIHRTRLHEQTEQRLERIASLHEIDKAISNSFDLKYTLNIMLDQVINHLGVNAADILLLDPYIHTLEFSAGHGFRSGAEQRSQLWVDEGQATRVAREQKIVSIPNFAESTEPFIPLNGFAGEDFMAYYGVPLIAKGQVKGVLEVFHRKPLKPDLEWLNFLETLAGQAAIAIDNAVLFDGLQRSNLELRLAYDATIEGWSHALDLRDRETEGHTQRVTETTIKLARAMGLSEAELIHVRRGALLHDIGKMGLPDSILLKPGKLTAEEWAAMCKHPTYAYEMLSPIQFLRPALDIPYCHHEKWDGTGYPRGLKGDEIPLPARIFTIVDIWDALRSDRPYRKAWPEKKVLAHLDSLTGKHLDPQMLEPFTSLVGGF